MKKIAFTFMFLLLSQTSILFSTEINSEFQSNLEKQLISATPGTIIDLPEGQFYVDTHFSLMVDNVTIKGKGMNKTILTFKDQKVGAEGFSVSAHKVKFEDFTIQNTKGDGIKINRASGVTIRRMKVEWTRGPHTENGGYGFYPVMCQNVLIEDSVVSGASDAGVYVGQSKNIIIRRNKAFDNVAGIEIENSVDADVYENHVYSNTGGILVFDMPDLTIYGEKTRVFNNLIEKNNTPNFAAPSNSVADVPTGTGVMITANRFVEVFNNKFIDNDTTHVLMISYFITGRDAEDEDYNPFPEGLYIYNNTYVGGGMNPQGGSSETSQELVGFLAETLGTPFPRIVWDGSYNKETMEDGKVPDYLKICIQDEASFIDLDALGEMQDISTDLTPHRCDHIKLPKIIISEE